MASGQRLLEIPLNLIHFGIIIDKCPALKMQIQTPVIQIDRANGGRVVIGYKHLGMDEARRVLIDLDGKIWKL